MGRGEPARRARQFTQASLALGGRRAKANPATGRMAARPLHEPQPRGDSPGGAGGGGTAREMVRAGCAMSACCNERSADKDMLAKDLAGFDGEIEASQRAAP